MDLLIVRHAKAEDRAATGGDAKRALIDEGVRKMRQAASGLRGQVPELGRVFTSPYVRAEQTARILADRYGCPVALLDALRPGSDPQAIADALSEADGAAAVVGHEPDLGRLACWFLTGRGCGALPLKKAGACLLRFRGDPGPGRADLRWLLTPKQLRQLAD